MERAQINLYDILTNVLNKESGIVTECEPYKTVIHYESGRKAEVRPEYLEPADQAVCARLEGLRENLKSDPRPSRQADDSGEPRDHKAALSGHFDKQIAKYPAAAKVLPEFWDELIKLVGDQPGKTWDMRWRSKKHFCPVINAKNLATQNWYACLYLLTGSTIRLEMRTELIPESDLELFPLPKTMFGSCRAVEYEYSDFKPELRAKYLDCLRKVYSRH